MEHACPAEAEARQGPPAPHAAERMLLDRNLLLVAARRGVDAARAQRLVASSLPPP